MNIYIAPARISNIELVDNVIKKLTGYIHFNPKKIELDLEIESAYFKERSQYFSSKIIAEAEKHTAKLDGKILIITEQDLFIPVLTYIFGEAQLNGKHAVVSVCRLHEEFYSGISDEKLLLKRTMKEVLHELGHTFGLKHCINWDCVMHTSPGIEEVDIKGDNFCSVCLEQIIQPTLYP